jgi:hypothetical protein
MAAEGVSIETEIEGRLKELLRSQQRRAMAHTVGEITIVVIGEHAVLLDVMNNATVVPRKEFCEAVREYIGGYGFIARVCK